MAIISATMITKQTTEYLMTKILVLLKLKGLLFKQNIYYGRSF